jgi:hypothetical protein
MSGRNVSGSKEGGKVSGWIVSEELVVSGSALEPPSPSRYRRDMARLDLAGLLGEAGLVVARPRGGLRHESGPQQHAERAHCFNRVFF